jgi:hypothetical protein
MQRVSRVLLDPPAFSIAAGNAALAVAAAGAFPRAQQLERSGAIVRDACAAKQKKPRKMSKGKRVALGHCAGKAGGSIAVPTGLQVALPFIEKMLSLGARRLRNVERAAAAGHGTCCPRALGRRLLKLIALP